MDRGDPFGEGMRQLLDQSEQRPFLELAVLVEAVVVDMAEIGLGLLHHRHVEEHAALADLVVGERTRRSTPGEALTIAAGFRSHTLRP